MNGPTAGGEKRKKSVINRGYPTVHVDLDIENTQTTYPPNYWH